LATAGLDYLAVHPEHQGKGVGSALVQSGMRQAEKLGLDIFIQAMKAGLGVYKRLGFHVDKEFIENRSEQGGKGDSVVYFMIYEQDPEIR
jgi:ribosomal protein S18 acetylase RimI-like enzyme